MGKHALLAGGVGLLLGLAIGSASTYFWLKPRLAAVSDQDANADQNANAEIPPEPSKREVRATLEKMLDSAGVDAEVISFRRVNWGRSEYLYEPDGHGGFKRLTKSVGRYSVGYEAELEFRSESQIQEDFALMWSPSNKLYSKGTAGISVHENRTFKKGERQQVRGVIHYMLQDGQWQLEPNYQINAGS